MCCKRKPLPCAGVFFIVIFSFVRPPIKKSNQGGMHFMRSYFLMASLLLASQTALAENNIQQLQGYDISRATAAFTQALRSNDSLYAALRQQPDLIKRLMLRPNIQN